MFPESNFTLYPWFLARRNPFDLQIIYFSFTAIFDGFRAIDLNAPEHRAWVDILRARADLKFTYVVSCQVYGAQKISNDPRDRSAYTNILNLMLT